MRRIAAIVCDSIESSEELPRLDRPSGCSELLHHAAERFKMLGLLILRFDSAPPNKSVPFEGSGHGGSARLHCPSPLSSFRP